MANAQLKAVPAKLVQGVAMSRSMIVRGRIIWAWKRLTPLQRENDKNATRSEYLDGEALGRVLDEKNTTANAKGRY